jgi:glycerol uptake facilitator-like aquaporin
VSRDLARRASAEAIGTAFLVAIVVGSGIYAQRLSPGQPGLQLLENAIATGGGLVALILAIGPISGGHFNPVVTLADHLLGGMSTADSATYVGAQVVGAVVGAITANLMFGLNAVSLSTHARSSGAMWFAEFVATLGLVTVILGVVRANRSHVAAFAVGGYIVAAYWFTSSTSFANPAVTVGRAFSNTFAGIKPSSVPMFVVAQLVGAVAAVALGKFWNPNRPAEHIVIEA